MRFALGSLTVALAAALAFFCVLSMVVEPKEVQTDGQAFDISMLDKNESYFCEFINNELDCTIVHTAGATNEWHSAEGW